MPSMMSQTAVNRNSLKYLEKIYLRLRNHMIQSLNHHFLVCRLELSCCFLPTFLATTTFVSMSSAILRSLLTTITGNIGTELCSCNFKASRRCFFFLSLTLLPCCTGVKNKDEGPTELHSPVPTDS